MSSGADRMVMERIRSHKELQKSMRGQMEQFARIAGLLETTNLGDQIGSLENNLKDLVNNDLRVKHHIQGLEESLNLIRSGALNVTRDQSGNTQVPPTNIYDRFGSYVQDLATQDDPDEFYKRHKYVQLFKSEVLRAQGKDDGAELDEDQELREVRRDDTRSDLTCPLTREIFTDPVKNRMCAHHYERQAIMNYIDAKGRGRARLKCPAAACGASVTKQSLDASPEMSLRVRKFNSAQAHKRGREYSDEDVLDL
eukprot:TRINITY_DN12636_c0_g1_i1.p1 TRINITY_DN12636_c0_g1~~TRINITY_DN12636_c0_g1_i1.p1  ORF type:complete len:254 (+),score=45.30 TRINITY_DN12636_c0_g1_i1:25-786(+)